MTLYCTIFLLPLSMVHILPFGSLKSDWHIATFPSLQFKSHIKDEGKKNPLHLSMCNLTDFKNDVKEKKKIRHIFQQPLPETDARPWPDTDEKSFYSHKKESAVRLQKLRISTADTLVPNSSIFGHIWRDQSFFSLFSLRAFRLSWSVFSSVMVEKVLYTHTITMMTVFSRRGIE